MTRTHRRHLTARVLFGTGLAFVASWPAYAVVLLVPEGFDTIQAAVDAAASTDTISVAAGTYTGAGNRDISIVQKNLILVSRDGPELTIIDCQRAGRAFFFDGLGFSPTVEGFSMINGNGYPGGALKTLLATPVIRHCRFLSNESGLAGAASLGYTATFEDCEFRGNTDNQGGGAVYALQGAPTFLRCVFAGNRAGGPGGAVRTDGARLTLTECTITGNSSDDMGGGVFSFAAPVTLVRTICRGNCAGELPQEIDVGTEVLTLECSNVDMSGVEAHELVQVDVIDADPLFCDPRSCSQGAEDGDYSLRSDSPCLPEGNACGVLIGALGTGCAAPGVGACCRTDGTCVLAGADACSEMQGQYVGDGTICEPDPCVPTATRAVSWGQVKAAFR